MNVKEYLKSVWNDLKYDEGGQVSWGAIPKSLYTKKPTPGTPWSATEKSALAKYSTKQAATYESIYGKPQYNIPVKQQPVYKAPVYKPPTPTYQAPAPVKTQAQIVQEAHAARVASYQAPQGFNVDLSGIWEKAGQMADNEINPQLSEIDRLLQEAGYTAEDAQRAISEAYPVARRSLQKSIYENMVAGEQGLAAMGTGRGGGRQELLARAGEREATGLESIETAKQRETGAIQRALGQYQGQLGTQRTALVGQRGGLQASYAEQLRGARFGEASTMANYGLQSAQLAEQARQFNAGLAETQRQYNQSLTSVGTTAGGGQPYATAPSGASYFLTEADLAALGLGTNAVKSTTGTPVVKKAVTPAAIFQGKPSYLQAYQMQRY